MSEPKKKVLITGASGNISHAREVLGYDPQDSSDNFTF